MALAWTYGELCGLVIAIVSFAGLALSLREFPVSIWEPKEESVVGDS
jgi:hypothetical protein